MTNEKAIMCLEDMKIKVPIPKAAKQARENNEALDVAIKALAESEHGTNLASLSTDCISRQAAIDAVRKSYDAILDFESDGHTVADSFEDIINALPSAQPEITHEQAVEYLQSTGWMQNHDLQMMLDGVHRFTAQPEPCEDAVSRQAAIDALNEVVKDHSITDFDAIASILDLPPAQPEIIRCKDCKYGVVDDPEIPFSRFCEYNGQDWNDEYHYCGYAERREDG